MVQSVETSPGIHQLLVGGTGPAEIILARDLSVFTDNGVSYDAYFVMGSINLVHPGELALLKFFGVRLQRTSVPADNQLPIK